MSSNTAEQELGRWLRSISSAWVHHPVDHPKARYWKPADFIVCHTGFMFLVESKEVSKGSRFSLSNWTAQQRNTALTARRDGAATYLLCVHFKELKQWRLYEVGVDVEVDGSGSLTVEHGDSFKDDFELAWWFGDAVAQKRVGLE